MATLGLGQRIRLSALTGLLLLFSPLLIGNEPAAFISVNPTQGLPGNSGLVLVGMEEKTI